MGSSPRGRGKLSDLREIIEAEGLIPARAGKTRPILAPWIGVTAHPRAGGENDDDGLTTHRRTGSSPRGRGKPSVISQRLVCSRLIPARAGKTRRQCRHGA